MLDNNILDQVKGIFAQLDNRFTFVVKFSRNREEASSLVEFVNDVASCSPNLDVVTEETSYDKLEFSLMKNGKNTGVKFRGIPNGHEFTSLLLAVLNADGKGKNLPDQMLTQRIKALKGNIVLQTYVSLSCTNCPDIVQSLNIISLINESITHEMIDGALFQDEAQARNIQAVPSVFADGKLLHVGRGSLADLLQKLEEKYGSNPISDIAPTQRNFDVIVLGGGPAGAAAAIYSARKGLKVAVVAERIGGQVKETTGIENLISVPHTTGDKLAADLHTHIFRYEIETFEDRKIEDVDLSGKSKIVRTIGGESFSAPAVVIATGASWKKLNIPGEDKYIGRGVAFCPHCDGPFYAGRHVAVIGGGNSGIEAAIDLAGICNRVTVVEFADTLKADTILQEKLKTLPNVEVFTSTQSTEIIGNDAKVTGLQVLDRTTGNSRIIELDGVFVQIGLSANSQPFKDQLETTPSGEIKIDESCRTAIAGVYAAGDVSTVPYKQIIIAMGEGAKAALSAFDDRVRGLF